MDGSLPPRSTPRPSVECPPPLAPQRPGSHPAHDAILAFLSEPRQLGAIAAHVGRSKSAVAQHLLALQRTGAVVRASWATYARADTHPAPPQPVQRPQPIRDAILAFLADQPRQAEAVAAHIARSTATATGHLTAMRRRGLVVRVAWGTYARTDRCPAPPQPDSITRGNPVRDRVLACLDQHQPRTLNEIACLTGMSADRAQQHLCLLRHAGLATQLRRGSYQRTAHALDAAPARRCTSIAGQ